ncbi:hypothetical protein GMJAKD_16210 [Candidatus Electrothrix aarhusensis]
MLSFQLKENAVDLLNIFESSKDFFVILDSITEGCSKADQAIKNILKGKKEEQNQAVIELRSVLINLKNVTQHNSPRKFYSSVELIQQKLQSVLESGQYQSDMVKELYNHIESFTVEFETATSPPYPPQSAVSLSIRATRLSYLLKGFQSALLFFVKNIDTNNENENTTELSLLLSSQLSVRRFALNIIAIDEIYNELCSLLQISTSEYPLLINKIESGSLLAKLSGHKEVIGLMVLFITSSAAYMHRNYTDEGRISSIPKDVKVIESVLNLSKELKAAGVDTSELEEQVTKSAMTIAQELNTLLEGQMEIIINKKSVSIGDELQKKLIKDKSALQLLQYKENP